MDLIDREAMMNYVRSNKINIGKVAHIVITKQETVNAIPLSVIDEITEELHNKMSSGQWSEGVMYGMLKACYIIDQKLKEYME